MPPTKRHKSASISTHSFYPVHVNIDFTFPAILRKKAYSSKQKTINYNNFTEFHKYSSFRLINHSYRVRLPPYVTCTQCVLQWTYYTGNMWGKCGNGTEAVGCGKPGKINAQNEFIDYWNSVFMSTNCTETFRNCADIAITSNTGGLPPIFVGQKNPFLLYYKDLRAPLARNVFPLIVR